MRSTFLAVSLLALATGVASAGTDIMAARYDNTVIATHSDGSTTKQYYRADHTFTAKHGYDWSSDGTWSVADGKLCLNYKSARAGKSRSECEVAQLRQVGDIWVDNGRRTTLVKGIQY
ncbi:MAG: hypothetical protein KGI68_15205 [Alphaproteobacteria bacterium]|nr:hypothetical protein [Alphaproteobacteria bacterium]MDE2163979.1 hypothetical protein [Alphaproteobacteria bacterium]MDE2500072.1 hypothetical protein [Alphaproteobacteria bacterium]